MSRLRSKIASFADYRAYCSGWLLEVLTDRRNKQYRSLTIENFLVSAGHIVVVVIGTGESNDHLRVVIVLDKLPRAEITNFLADEEPHVSVHKFLARLAVGEVSELAGCLVMELQSHLSYFDIVQVPIRHESRGEQSIRDEWTLLILVDIYGIGNCFRYDAELPFSRTHHKWEHISTLDFIQHPKVPSEDAVVVKFFNFHAETGEIVYCTSCSTSRVNSANTTADLRLTVLDEVHMSSLHFKSNHVIEQGRAMTVGSFGNVANVLCNAYGYWIVCADLQVAYYRYDTCKTCSLDVAAQMASLDPLFHVNSVLSAISTDRDANRSSLYLCVHQLLLRVYYDDSGVNLGNVHRLDKALHHKHGPDTSDVVLLDMHVAAEQLTSNRVNAVVCVASALVTHLLYLEYPTQTSPVLEHPTICDARLCITLPMPKSRSKVPERVRFIAPAAAPSDFSALLHLCRDRAVYSITATGANERSTRSGDRYAINDLESVISDVDEIKQRRDQIWLSLFASSRRHSAQHYDVSFFREGDAEVPLTSIHQRTTLREYLHRARNSSDSHDAEDSPSFALSMGHAPYTHLSGTVKILLERVGRGEVHLEKLLCDWTSLRLGGENEAFLTVPFTTQTIAEVLEQLGTNGGASSPRSASSRSPRVSRKRLETTEVSTPTVFSTGSNPTTASWIADMDLATLLPTPQRSHSKRLYEFGRSVDPLLVTELVQSLSPELSSAEEDNEFNEKSKPAHLSAALFYANVFSVEKVETLFAPTGNATPLLRTVEFSGDGQTAQARALSLDVVLHLLLLQRPTHFMDVLYCLLEIEQRGLHRLGGAPESPESPVPSLMPKNNPTADKILPKVRSFRTSIGSAGEGVPQQVVKTHQQHAEQHNRHHQARVHHARHPLPVVDDDDDMFGLGLSGAVLQARAQAQAREATPVDISVHLHRNRLLGTRNVSTTVFDDEAEGSASESQSESGSENSDGEDMFGIFRDVDEDKEPVHRLTVHATDSVDAANKTSKEVWSARELLRRATNALHQSGEHPEAAQRAPILSSRWYIPLLARCEVVAQSVLDRLSSNSDDKASTDSALRATQIDALLQVLLLCHQPVQVAQYMVKLNQFASLVAFCLRLGASATHLAAETVDITPSHPVARYVQAVGGARTSARFSSKNQSESAKWEAFLEELYAVSENNLRDTLAAVLSQAEDAGIVPTAAQVRLVEYIIALKLTIRCLLARPEGFKDVVSTVLELVQCRPQSVPLEAMRAWVNAFSVNGADKSRILLSGILGNR